MLDITVVDVEISDLVSDLQVEQFACYQIGQVGMPRKKNETSE